MERTVRSRVLITNGTPVSCSIARSVKANQTEEPYVWQCVLVQEAISSWILQMSN